MKKNIVTLVSVIIIIAVNNIAPVRYMLSYIIDENHFRYSNANGSFTMILKSGYYQGVVEIPYENCFCSDFFREYNVNHPTLVNQIERFTVFSGKIHFASCAGMTILTMLRINCHTKIGMKYTR